MRLLAAPASLKGVLSAVEAAAALAAGMRRAGAEAVELPVADGGEGTAEVLARVLGGEWHAAEASDPLGRPVTARFLLFSNGNTAIVESADARWIASRLSATESPKRRVCTTPECR